MRALTSALSIGTLITLGKRTMTNGEKMKPFGEYRGVEKPKRFYSLVLTHLNNRGLEDILIACTDNLSGFSQAIRSVFPQADIQLCVIHQIRNSMKYVASKDQKEFMSDLKFVYKADTKEQAESALLDLEEKWGKKYPTWNDNWERLSAYFDYTAPIRKAYLYHKRSRRFSPADPESDKDKRGIP